MPPDSFLFFLRNRIPIELCAPFCVKSPGRSACFPLSCFQYNSYCRGKHSAGSSISSSTGCFFTAHFCDPLRACQNNKLARTSVLLCSLAGTMTVTSNASSIAYFPVIRNLLMQGYRLSLIASYTRGKQRSGWNSSDLLITSLFAAMTEYPSSSPRHADVVRVRVGHRPVPTSRPVMCQSLQKSEKREQKKKKAALAWTTPLWDCNGNSRRFALSANLLYLSASPARAEEPTWSVKSTNNSKWCSNKYEWNRLLLQKIANTIGHQQLKMVFEQNAFACSMLQKS